MTTVVSDHQGVADPRTTHPRRPWAGVAVGGFYLCMAGVHLGLVAADPETYRGFAEGGLFGFVRQGWESIFMAAPAVWGSLLMAGELTIGVLLIIGGRCARWGWTAVIVFHLLLMLFGWWVWVWSLPALAVAVTLARRDLAAGGRR